MGARTLYGTGGYATGERWTVATPANRPAGCPLVVVAHGAGGTGHSYATADSLRGLNVLAASGCVVIAADLGSTDVPIDGWGNDTAVGRVDDVIAWAATEWQCATDTVALIGDSAGAATMLGWAWRNPASTAAVVTRVGVVDIGAIYDDGNGNAFLVGLIDDAYGDAWPAAAATHDPALNTELLAPLANRIRFYYSTDDSLVPAASVTATADAIGCRAISLGAVDHDPFPTIDNEAVSSFIRSGLRGTL